MKFTGCSFSAGSTVCKCQLLPMAARARFLAIHRHTFVVEEISAEFNFGGVHRVVRGNNRTWKRLGYVPLKVDSLGQKAGRHDDHQKCKPVNQRWLPSWSCRILRDFRVSVSML